MLRCLGAASKNSFFFIFLGPPRNHWLNWFCRYSYRGGNEGREVVTLSSGKWWNLAERSERCASVPKVADSNPSGGSESTFRSDLLLTAKGTSSTRAPIVIACLLCYPSNTLCFQRLEPLGRAAIPFPVPCNEFSWKY
jgi:hypothetical protein